MFSRPRQSGFTLIELLIVVALLSLAAGMILPSASPSFHDQLQSAAEVLSGDLAYARSLAVANDSTYRLTFDTSLNQYIITHAGTNTALDALPRSPYASPTDPATQHIVRLAKLPTLGSLARLHAVRALSTSPQAASDVSFGPFGETTRPEETQIWLTAGSGVSARYLSVRINPVTGLTWIENFQTTDPVSPVGATVENGSGS